MALPQSKHRAAFAAFGKLLEKRRPKPEIRHLLDIRADIDGHSVVVYEVRPSFTEPQEVVDHAVAKAKWIGTENRWKLYWMRADMRWHLYEPGFHLKTIDAIVEEVDKDPCGCFWG